MYLLFQVKNTRHYSLRIVQSENSMEVQEALKFNKH